MCGLTEQCFLCACESCGGELGPRGTHARGVSVCYPLDRRLNAQVVLYITALWCGLAMQLELVSLDLPLALPHLQAYGHGTQAHTTKSKQ